MILHIVCNPVTHDSRVLKETMALAESGIVNEVEIAGFYEQGYSEWEKLTARKIWRVRLSTRPLPKDIISQAIKFAEWYIRIIRNFRNVPLRVIHCHDLDPLPIAARLKRLTGAKLIYDAHELETEREGSRGIRQALARCAEQWLIPHVDAIITVSPSIREWYLKRFPEVSVTLVRNIPPLPAIHTIPEPLRERFKIHEEALLFIYLGGLVRGRGIEITLDAFSDKRVPHHVLFMGSGPLQDTIEAVAHRCSRIHYLPPVPPSQVLDYASGADAGLCLIEDVCLSYRYCLPNKLFESLLAGLPVLASDLPDQAGIIRSYGGGWVVPNKPSAIIDFLTGLDRGTVERIRHELPKRVQNLRWENEAEQLLGLYKQLLAPKDTPH